MAFSESTLQALRNYHLTVGQGFVDMRDDMIRLGLASPAAMDDMEASVSRLAQHEVEKFLGSEGDDGE